ncbi:hypothetical protein KCP70_18650 [Salmonella enterica subsp. enterica]|nr:hypothetical protein KCP70_18650 [Salmonella enterica subsp. enterica]
MRWRKLRDPRRPILKRHRPSRAAGECATMHARYSSVLIITLPGKRNQTLFSRQCA